MVAEGQAEAKRALTDAEAGWYHIGYAEGLKVRKAAIQAEIDLIEMEERGARDALSVAFEEQKKYEQVAESARLAAAKEAGRRENAELDEVGMQNARRSAR
jgi:flagellar FliJ protein